MARAASAPVAGAAARRWPQAVVALDLDLPVRAPGRSRWSPSSRCRPWCSTAAPASPRHRGGAAALRLRRSACSALIVGGLLLDTVLPVGRRRPPARARCRWRSTWLVVDLALLRLAPRRPAGPAGSRCAPALRRALDARFELAQTLAVGARCCSPWSARSGSTTGPAAWSPLAAAGRSPPPRCSRCCSAASGSLAATSASLGLVAAGLLLATSLRGWTITGHDIQAEFLAFRLTNDAQNWEMSALPERLQRLPERQHPADRAGAGDRAVRRAGLQGAAAAGVRDRAGADLPALAPLPARAGWRWSPRSFTMAFPTFFTDMPYLVRQEIAFFFLALMLLAATEPAGRRGSRPLVARLRPGRGAVPLLHDLRAADGAGRGAGRRWRSCRPCGAVRGDAARAQRPRARRLVLLNPLVVAFLLAASLAVGRPGHRTPAATPAGRQPRRSTRSPARATTARAPRTRPTGSSRGDQTTPRERMDMLRRRDARLPRREDPAAGPAHHEARPGRAAPEIVPASKAPLTASGKAWTASARPVARQRGREARLRRADAGLPAARPGLAVWRAAAPVTRRGLRARSPSCPCGAIGALGADRAGAQPVGRLRRAARLPADAAGGRAGDGDRASGCVLRRAGLAGRRCCWWPSCRSCCCSSSAACCRRCSAASRSGWRWPTPAPTTTASTPPTPRRRRSPGWRGRPTPTPANERIIANRNVNVRLLAAQRQPRRRSRTGCTRRC